MQLANNSTITGLLPWFKSAGENLRSLIFPACCISCNKPLWGHRNPYLCATCLDKVTWLDNNCCKFCGYQSGKYIESPERCRECRGKDLKFTKAVAVVRYSGSIRKIIKAFKFHAESSLAMPMAALMHQRMLESEISEADLLIPVPLHDKRLRERGYNQSELLAREISRLCRIPYNKRCLLRTKNTAPQSMLRKKERRLNPLGAFMPGSADLTGKKILLIDDIMTTGSTVSECSRVCRAAGAAQINILVFAR